MLEKIIRKYYDEIFRYCYHHVESPALAEDLCQDTFVSFIEHYGRYRQEGKTRNFLLFCSARFRSSLAMLAIGMTVLIGPAFFPMSKNSGLWNNINYLFPVRAVDFKKILGSYVSYRVGGWVIPYVEMVVLVYTAIGIAALISTRKGFVKVKTFERVCIRWYDRTMIMIHRRLF